MKQIKQKDSESQRLDIFKWGVVLLLLGAGVYGNYFYAAEPISLRLIGWIVVALLAGSVAALTTKGREFLSFAKEARIELRKVVWPTRQETVHTTLIVMAMVTVMALLLWGMDSVLLWLVGFLTGQRG